MLGIGRRHEGGGGEKSHGGGGRGDGATRQRLAITVVSFSVFGITALSAMAIGLAPSAERAEMTRLVFTSLLALFGTWVGTVLAFYFAREGQEIQRTATENAFRLAGRLDAHTPVRHMMIPKSRIISYDLGPQQDPRTIELSDLYQKMETAGRQRMPILADSGAVRYVVHKSTIVGFANVSGRGGSPAGPGRLTGTMGDLLEYGQGEFEKAVEAFGAVGPDAVLADARRGMGSVEGCNDVFVTTNGRRGDPMIGWLTNTDLAGLE